MLLDLRGAKRCGLEALRRYSLQGLLRESCLSSPLRVCSVLLPACLVEASRRSQATPASSDGSGRIGKYDR